jgi:hypothetical protein
MINRTQIKGQVYIKNEDLKTSKGHNFYIC